MYDLRTNGPTDTQTWVGARDACTSKKKGKPWLGESTSTQIVLDTPHLDQINFSVLSESIQSRQQLN